MALPLGGPDGFPLRDAWYLTAGLHTGGLIASWAVDQRALHRGLVPRGPLAASMPRGACSWRSRRCWRSWPVSALKAISVDELPVGPDRCSAASLVSSHIGLRRAAATGARATASRPDTRRPASCSSAATSCSASDAPRIARAWLLSALIAGFVLGGAQQLRGAHFMSHTLWTAWICACVAWAVEIVFAGLRARQ
jgi:hypothetical protein